MPPRIADALRICASSLVMAPHAAGQASRSLPAVVIQKHATLSFHSSAVVEKDKRPPRHLHNPFAQAKAKANKERNLARQAELKQQRERKHVDPVVGTPTPFTELLGQKPTTLPPIDMITKQNLSPEDVGDVRLNHFLKKEELPTFFERSKILTFPSMAATTGAHNPMIEKQQDAQHSHQVEAVKRIVSLGLGSSKDITRENKLVCINTFGRHITDNTLPPDPLPRHDAKRKKHLQKTPRVGPDTGSSEVQAAILTTKIRVLAEHLKANKHDKMNKRNLRLLVHKRQKLLKYLKRKEKGGIRYRNVMAALGLDDHAVHSELFL
ncbi:hypothetical protein BDZ91DRAFT_19569 [Kalaharituber pfeilii]|nr:hypothetical protein BDZ91DRAFT_19569 [Kalaharituber pfeilii]